MTEKPDDDTFIVMQGDITSNRTRTFDITPKTKPDTESSHVEL
jgi:hypothetical protein